MISAHKYLDLDHSVLQLSSMIIFELRRDSILAYDELLAKTKRDFGNNAEELYPYALSFLFLLDKIKYHGGKLDAFELNEIK